MNNSSDRKTPLPESTRLSIVIAMLIDGVPHIAVFSHCAKRWGENGNSKPVPLTGFLNLTVRPEDKAAAILSGDDTEREEWDDVYEPDPVERCAAERKVVETLGTRFIKAVQAFTIMDRLALPPESGFAGKRTGVLLWVDHGPLQLLKKAKYKSVEWVSLDQVNQALVRHGDEGDANRIAHNIVFWNTVKRTVEREINRRRYG